MANKLIFQVFFLTLSEFAHAFLSVTSPLPASMTQNTIHQQFKTTKPFRATMESDIIVSSGESLDVRIHGTWYDLQHWRKSHPAGESWIDMYKNRDCTEVMDAFHSEKARKMWQRLPKSKEIIANQLEKTVPAVTPVQKEYRKLRMKLESEGWFKRDIVHEAKLLFILSSLFTGAVVSATKLPILSTILLSLAFTNAGWIGHDYIHGTDKFCKRMRMLAPLLGGLGCSWWREKHNRHHAYTNQMGVDGDMAEGPFLFTYAPDPSKDSPLRKVQHVTFPFVFSLLFLLWRVRSIQVVIPAVRDNRLQAKKELFSLLVHYIALFTIFPTNIWVPAIFLSGLISACIVTPTHQSDAFFIDEQDDWVTAQFTSTRNAVLTNPFSTWLWGGMQYQLEHHLFPSMPRSKYPKLRSIIRAFAQKNGLNYLESGEVEILKMNWELYRDVASADTITGSPKSCFQNNKDKV